MLRLMGQLIDSLSSYPALFGCFFFFFVNTNEALFWSDGVETKLIYGGAEGSGMPTAAGLIGPCTAQSSREQPWMWGDTLLWQLVGRVATVGCTLVELNLEINSQIDHEIWGRIQSKHITAGWLYVFFLFFFASVCVCVWMPPPAAAADLAVHLYLSWVIFQGDVTGKGSWCRSQGHESSPPPQNREGTLSRLRAASKVHFCRRHTWH